MLPATKDQMRAIERLHGEFAKRSAAYFSEIQQVVIDFKGAFVDQTTFGEFILSLGNPTGSYTFTIEPFSRPAVLDYSQHVLDCFISHALGKKADGPLTTEERPVMGKIVSRNLTDLEAIWEPVEKILVSDAELETDPADVRIVQPGDTVLLVAFELNAPRHSGLITLCYPLVTLESVLPRLV